MKYLIVILFIFCFASVKAQHSTNPAIKQPYWVDYDFVQNDSGYIPAHRDTLWTPRKTGTQVLWENAGVDTSIWTYTGANIGRKWRKGISAIQINDVNHLQDSLDSKWLRVGSDIYNNNSANVIVGTPAGGSYSEKLQGYGDFRIRTSANKNLVVSDAFGLSYLTDAGSVANLTVTASAISMPFSKLGIGESITGNFTDPSLAVTRITANTASTVLNIGRINGTVTQSNLLGAEVNYFVVNGTINQTGTSNAPTRGVYVNNTLTSAVNYRAIEVARGRIFFGTNYVNNAALDSVLYTDATGKVQQRLVTDYITAGTGIIISGTGTAADPRVITNSGGGGGGGGAIKTVVGTANRVTISGDSDLVINISTAYAGQNTITTLGTIGTGTWQGTAIGDTYISSAPTWNAKESALTFSTPISRSVNTISIANAAADGSTKGAASFTATDFDATSGNIAIDYTNGQAATTSLKGFLTSTDWNTFNGKQAAITGGATTITSSNLTVSRALVSDGSGKVGVATTTSTEVGYLSGVTNNLQFAVLQYTTQTLTDGATITMNCNNGFNGIVTLAGNRTLAFSNFPSKGTIMIKVIQDATGSRTLTLPANSKVPLGFGSGTTINLSTTGAAYDILYCFYDGTNYNWTIAKNFQ